MDFFVHMKGGPRTSTPAKTKYEDFQRPLEPPRTMLKKKLENVFGGFRGQHCVRGARGLSYLSF